MRITRRGLLAGAAATGATLGIGGYALARPDAVAQPTRIDIRATPIENLSTREPDRRRFGGLTFRSGLILASSQPSFGGYSGLARPDGGRRLVAMSDNAQWLFAGLAQQGPRLSGLTDAVLAPMLFADGKPLRRTRYYDTEGLAIAGSDAYVSVERRHAILRFPLSRDGMMARGELVGPLPREVRDLPSNSGLEAIGVAPPRSPLSGAIVAIAEQAREGDDTPTLGVIVKGGSSALFTVARSRGFDITDLAFLPSGEVLLLERRFSLLLGLAVRLRRFAPDAIRPGARVDGPILYESEPTHQVDNMEGLSVHRAGDDLVVSMISDDNFSALQRTLLLEFTLGE